MKKKQLTTYPRYLFLIIVLLFTSLLTMRTFKEVQLKDIHIIGSDFFEIIDINDNASLELPKSLILIKTKLAENKLIDNLSLKKVSVVREILPFRLKIYLQTRTPIAYGEKIEGGRTIEGFIDEEGYFIPKRFAEVKQKIINVKVYGWQKRFSRQISRILSFYNMNDTDLSAIYISKQGFIILEEKNSKKILLGSDLKEIDNKLSLMSKIKTGIKEDKIFKNIESIDITDSDNPIIKVFKP